MVWSERWPRWRRARSSTGATIPYAGCCVSLLQEGHVHAQLSTPVAIGASNVCGGAASYAAGFEEARHALIGSTVLKGRSALMTYDELGPYKYLLRMSLDGDIRDVYRDAVDRLAAYDVERSASLVLTLEEFLRRRGNISATSEALFVHPNTLRQRLRRISELSGIDLRKDDWLMVEIAVKLVRLHQAMAPDAGHTSGSERV
jgi:DNA-binding PucR family transcriptional regulator